MENISEGSGATGGDQESHLSAMLSSPSAGGMRLAGNYAQRGSPGVVRRAASKPISIIRSTSVPAQLQDRCQPAAGVGGGSGGNATAGTTRRGMHNRDRSLQHDFNSSINSSAAGGFSGIAQSLPIPQAPLLAGSLPPSRFLDDLPPLSLGPQADMEAFSPNCGALSASLKANRLYATSCPANLGGVFGRPPGSKINPSMGIVEEGTGGEEGEQEEDSPEPKSVTALSILESLAVKVVAAPGDGSALDAESVESLVDSAERLAIQDDDVFELEGLDGVSGDMEALSLSEAGTTKIV